ncbi:hypothetical protein [Protofrankia symbiont of Coriaria ruscifolia]|uniref:Uncharacterized protein n=1 Tax=Candidatus Protofrankia californiensis TaxID=1839754 RepID=A0A1C3NWA4_9ACTN|nr:hypothetical protein [Protofrankia symbiont of Coriaria ruscifolia]SBW20783.1 hypothetical protein FDG2_1802 [Candidatus Protofrankia californiensis]
MPSIPPTDHGPWRNPFDGRRFVSMRRTEGGLHEVTVSPGADLHDIVDVTATMPSVVYLDHRPAEPSDPTVILTFGPIPTYAGRRPSRSHGTGTAGWTPALDHTDDPPTLGELDVRSVLDRSTYQLYGRHLNEKRNPTL